MTPVLTALLIGFFIGAQHSLEPDHLAAVSTMLPEKDEQLQHKTHRYHPLLKGMWWGLGHGSSIALLGVPLILLNLEVPEAVEKSAEMMVAVMLVALGARAIFRGWRLLQRKNSAQEEGSEMLNIKRPSHVLPVGLLHGLAGSGAAIVLATTTAPSQLSALLFLLVFILGSTLSMALTTWFVSMPLRQIQRKNIISSEWVLALSGVLSMVIGVWWGLGA